MDTARSSVRVHLVTVTMVSSPSATLAGYPTRSVRCYDGYNTHPSVTERLGPDAGTPQPRGFPIAPFDPRIVEKVRHIGPRYQST